MNKAQADLKWRASSSSPGVYLSCTECEVTRDFSNKYSWMCALYEQNKRMHSAYSISKDTTHFCIVHPSVCLFVQSIWSRSDPWQQFDWSYCSILIATITLSPLILVINQVNLSQFDCDQRKLMVRQNAAEHGLHKQQLQPYWNKTPALIEITLKRYAIPLILPKSTRFTSLFNITWN